MKTHSFFSSKPASLLSTFALLFIVSVFLPACEKEHCRKPACTELGTSTANSKNTDFKINTVSLNGDCIKLDISFSGCSPDNRKFVLVWDGMLTKTNPSGARLQLIDEATAESCEAYFTKSVSFNVKKIKTSTHQQTVMLSVDGFPGTISY